MESSRREESNLSQHDMQSAADSDELANFSFSSSANILNACPPPGMRATIDEPSSFGVATSEKPSRCSSPNYSTSKILQGLDVPGQIFGAVADEPSFSFANTSIQQSLSQLESYNRSLMEKESFLAQAFEQVEMLSSDLRHKQEKLAEKEKALRVSNDTSQSRATPLNPEIKLKALVADLEKSAAKISALKRENGRLSTSNRELLATNKHLKTQLNDKEKFIEQFNGHAVGLRKDLKAARAISEQHKEQHHALKAECDALKSTIAELKEKLAAKKSRQTLERKTCSSVDTQTDAAPSVPRKGNGDLIGLLHFLLQNYQIYAFPQEAMQSQLDPNESFMSVDCFGDIIKLAESAKNSLFEAVLTSLKSAIPLLKSLESVSTPNKQVLQQLFFQFLVHFVEPKNVPTEKRAAARAFCLHLYNTELKSATLDRSATFQLSLACLDVFIPYLCESGEFRSNRTATVEAVKHLLEFLVQNLPHSSGSSYASRTLITQNEKHFFLHSHIVSIFFEFLNGYFSRCVESSLRARSRRNCDTLAETIIAKSISVVCLHMSTAKDIFVEPFFGQVLQSSVTPAWIEIMVTYYLHNKQEINEFDSELAILENMCVVLQHLSKLAPSCFPKATRDSLAKLVTKLNSCMDGVSELDFTILNLKSVLQALYNLEGE